MKSNLKFSLLAFLLFSAMSSFSQDFITTWDMSKNGVNAGQLTFGVQATGGSVSYTWTSTGTPGTGGGTIAAGTNAILNIPVSTTGIVTLRLGTGGTQTNLKRFYLAGANDCLRLTAVTQWGSAVWTNLNSAFQGCANLTTVSTIDAPVLTASNLDLGAMFENCSRLNAGSFDTWATSNVVNMARMFNNATIFNQSLATWDVGRVAFFNLMFANSAFNQPLNAWNIGASVPAGTDINMSGMFNYNKAFNQPLNAWNVGKVNNMAGLFQGAIAFNQPINTWNVSKVTSMNGMFQGATSFNQPLNTWDVSKVTNMGGMFQAATAFNQDLSAWDVSAVSNFASMFASATNFSNAGIPLSPWRPDAATDLSAMFQLCNYNQPLNGNWCGATLNGVTNMSNMFNANTAFNQDISCWDVSTVTNFNSMFNGATAFTNGDISLETWNPVAAIDMSSMFQQTRYNKSLKDKWNGTTLNGVTSLANMFNGNTVFNQDLSGWDVSTVNNFSGMFSSASAYTNAGISLETWNPMAATDMSAMFQLCRYNMPLKGNWCGTTLSGVTTMLRMFNGNTAFNQDINCWNVSKVTIFQNMFFGATAFNQNIADWDVSAGTTFAGMFSGATAFANGGVSLDTWNPVAATDMSAMFQQTRYNMPLQNRWCGATLNGVTTMAGMFNGNTVFNQDISCWDVSTVTSFASMFQGASAFNQSLCGWDVANATNFSFMFSSATAFSNNGIALSCWIPTAATNMSGMFALCAYNSPLAGGWCGTTLRGMLNMSTMFNGNRVFNQDLSCWDVSTVTSFSGQFQNAVAFNQNLCNWSVDAGTNFSNMFSGATVFNNNGTALSCWTPTAATNLSAMFQQCAYNLPLAGGWGGNTLNGVDNMSNMFNGNTVFNQDISGWDVSTVTNLTQIFSGATAFNNNGVNLAGPWNTIAATNMSSMFLNATSFNQSLADLEIKNVTTMTNMLSNSGLTPANYDATLTGWQAVEHKTGVPLGATNMKYCASFSQRLSLISTDTWTITGDVQNCSPGGISLNLTVWLDATRLTQNNGINVTNGIIDTWGNSVVAPDVPKNFVQATAGIQPSVAPSSLNFNPLIRFDGTTFLRATSTLSGYRATPHNQYTVFIVGRYTNDGPIISHESNTTPVISSRVTRMGIATQNDVTLQNYQANSAAIGIATYVYTPKLLTAPFTNGRFEAYLNGSVNGTIGNINLQLPTSTGDYLIGANSSGTDIFNGALGEVIVYANNTMGTLANRRRVESYLSLKWGTTLGIGKAFDYLNSQGATVWTGNATYQNDIAGIGRDDNTGLNQKQSRSQNGGDVLVMALGSIAYDNASNNNTFAENGQYLIWGDNNTTSPSLIKMNIPGYGVNNRIQKVWKLQNSGNFNQEVTVYYPKNPLVQKFGKLPKYLIYSNAENFNGTTKAQVRDNGIVNIKGSDFVSFKVTFPYDVGDLYMTFGAIRQSMVNPSGISSTIQGGRIKH